MMKNIKIFGGRDQIVKILSSLFLHESSKFYRYLLLFLHNPDYIR